LQPAYSGAATAINIPTIASANCFTVPAAYSTNPSNTVTDDYPKGKRWMGSRRGVVV
jgi:hypothetical protein